MNPYTYVFVRKDIPLHAQIVQSNHATLEMGIRLKKEKKPLKTSYLIMLEVANEESLEEIADSLSINKIDHHMFYEPDWPISGYTAICTEPIYGEDRLFFKKFKLWKNNN